MNFKKIFSVSVLIFIISINISHGSRISTLPQPGVKSLGNHLTDIDNNFKELYRLIFAGESGYTGLGAGIITSGTLSDSVIPSGITRDTELTAGLATKQNASANLTTFAGITPSANILSILGAADYPAVRGLLDLEPGVDFLSPAGVNSAITSGITGKQDTNEHLTDLADGSLTGSKVGTGISATNITTGTLPDAVIPSTITRDSELTTALGSYTTTSALTTLLAGKMNTATGTPDGTKFLRDDLTWQIVSAGGGDDWDANNDSIVDIGYLPSALIVDTELTTILSGYVLTSVLSSDYVTTATLSTNLNNYVSSAALTTILNDYIQTGDSVSLGSITSTGSITSSGGTDGEIGIWWSGNNTIAPIVTELNGIYPGSDGIYYRWNGNNTLISGGGSGSVYVDGSIVNNPNLDSNGTVDVSVSGSNISSNVKANSLTLNNLTTGSVITSSESVLNEDTSVMTSGAVVKYINDTVNHLVNTKLSDAGFTIANYINPVSSPVEVTEASYTVSGNVYDNGTIPTVEVSLNSGSYTSADVTGTTSPWGWSELLTLISGSNTIDVRVTNSDLEVIQLPQVSVNYAGGENFSDIIFHTGAENNYLTNIPVGLDASIKTLTRSTDYKLSGTYSFTYTDNTWNKVNYTNTADGIFNRTEGVVGGWIRTGATIVDDNTYFEAYYDNSNYVNLRNSGATGIEVLWEGNGVSYQVYCDNVITSNTEHYISFSFNNTSIKIYIDGEEKNTVKIGTYTPMSTSIPNGNISIGGSVRVGSSPVGVYYDQWIISNDPNRNLFNIRTSMP